MYDLVKIVNKSLENLSWVNTENLKEMPLGDTFTTARRYYNQLGIPALDLEAVESILGRPQYFGYEAYQFTKTYSQGEKVWNENQETPRYYISAVDNNTSNDLTDNNFWTPKYLFAELLNQMTSRVIEITVAKVVSKKKDLNQTKKVLLDSTLIDVSRIGQSTTVKEGAIRGISIKPKDYNNLVFAIKQLGVKLTESQDLTIYIYHESKESAPITSFTIQAGKDFNFNDIDEQKLSYIKDALNTGGEFKVCYYESDLIGSAIEQDLNYYKWANCGCNNNNSRRANKTYQFIDVLEPFYVASGNIPGDLSLWDYEAEQPTTGTNYGFNFKFQVECDLTEIIIANLSTWDDAFIKGMKVALYEIAQESLNHNDSKMMMNNFASVLLSEDGGSLRAIYDKACADVDLDISDLDSPCMPKKPRKTGRYGVI